MESSVILAIKAQMMADIDRCQYVDPSTLSHIAHWVNNCIDPETRTWLRDRWIDKNGHVRSKPKE